MKKLLAVFILVICLFAVGITAVYFDFTDIEKLNTAPEYSKKQKEVTYQFDIKDKEFYQFNSESAYIIKKVNNDLKGQIRVHVNYYQDFGDVYFKQTYRKQNQEKYYQIDYFMNLKSSYTLLGLTAKNIMEDLKNKSLHHYDQLFYPKITVEVSEEYQNIVQIHGKEENKDQFLIESN